MTIKIQNIKPEIQAGDSVLVKWSNRQTYKGVIKDKLRKNWSVEITDSDWHHTQNFASVPLHALVRRVH